VAAVDELDVRGSGDLDGQLVANSTFEDEQEDEVNLDDRSDTEEQEMFRKFLNAVDDDSDFET
jgi:hypothetical protein